MNGNLEYLCILNKRSASIYKSYVIIFCQAKNSKKHAYIYMKWDAKKGKLKQGREGIGIAKGKNLNQEKKGSCYEE